MKNMTAAIALTVMAFALPVAASGTTTPYELIFRQGTLDPISPDHLLIYERTVINAGNPEAAKQASGEITLSFPKDAPQTAALQFRQDGRHRQIGSFPADVGNPLIMYHLESLVRDLASITGGSPFYIRNRLKAALQEPVEASDVSLAGDPPRAGQSVTLHPFEGDPNAIQMGPFAGLTVTVVVSEAVPGWYQRLAAEAPGYASIITYQNEETAE